MYLVVEVRTAYRFEEVQVYILEFNARASRAQLNSSWGASPPNALIPIRPFCPPSCHPSVCVSVGLHVYLNNNIVMFLVISICVAMTMFILVLASCYQSFFAVCT